MFFVFCVIFFFFFKQKTAYEMRISDWSSDVCSSDLGAPLIARFEPDCRLEHLERCWIGRGLRAARLAEHALDLRHALDHAIRLLEQLGSLCCRQSRQRGRHIEQVALVHWRQELAAEPGERPDRKSVG